MLPEATPLSITQQAIGLWSEVAAAYDAIEGRLGLGTWEGFEEVATHIAALQCELQPHMATIAAMRADGTTPAPVLTEFWHELDIMLEALARRQKQLERAAMAARDTTAARLVRARIARSRAAGYTPLSPWSPRFTSRRV